MGENSKYLLSISIHYSKNLVVKPISRLRDVIYFVLEVFEFNI